MIFDALRELNLPIGQYAITGSGPLGIRNLRPIGDIDIIVDEDLWTLLAQQYGVTDEGGVRKIVFPGGIVEAFTEGAFYSESKEVDAPTISKRLAQAEVINGLPFESLEHTLYYKRKSARPKDFADIILIENWLRNFS